MNKVYFLIIINMVFFHFIKAQTVYEFNYNQQLNNTVIPTRTLFFQHEDGSGFMRIRYSDNMNTEYLIEADLMEENVMTKEGGIDSTKMYVRAIQPRILLGKTGAKIDTPLLLFSLNKNNGFLEPEALMNNNSIGELQINKEVNFKARQLTASELSKEFFANYFQEGEEFLEAFFKNTSKDITPAEKDIQMHLILVADTTDEKIGNSCAMDVKRVKEGFERIAGFIGAKVIVYSIMGSNYGLKTVNKQLDKLTPAGKDMVIFYYTGHGYRKEGNKSPYPNLDLRVKPDDDYTKETLNMFDIYSRLKQKKAKVTIVLSDCCNSYVGDDNAIASAPIQRKSISMKMSMDNVRTLFLKDTVSILATAADISQKASSNNNFGGFFSYFFKTALELQCSQSIPHASWDNLLEATKEQTYKKSRRTYCAKPYTESNICNQVPRYSTKN